MDYPHPTLYLNNDKEIIWENAYDDKIGAWDKITIAYGYQDFPKGTNEQKALEGIIQEGIKDGYTFITDKDSRPLGSAHPTAHLWDNGDEPLGELNNLLSIRQIALNNFVKTYERPNFTRFYLLKNFLFIEYKICYL